MKINRYNLQVQNCKYSSKGIWMNCSEGILWLESSTNTEEKNVDNILKGVTMKLKVFGLWSKRRGDSIIEYEYMYLQIALKAGDLYQGVVVGFA